MNKKNHSNRKSNKLVQKINLDTESWDINEKSQVIRYRLTDKNVSHLLLKIAKTITKYRKEDVDLCLQQPLLAVSNRESLLELNKSYISEFGKSEAQAQIEYRLEMWDTCEVCYARGSCDPLMLIIKLGVQYCHNDFINKEAYRDRTSKHHNKQQGNAT